MVEPQQNKRKSAARGIWGGRRPGAGAPKDSLNGAVPRQNNHGENDQEAPGLLNTEIPSERKILPKTIKTQTHNNQGLPQRSRHSAPPTQSSCGFQPAEPKPLAPDSFLLSPAPCYNPVCP